jgi:glutathione synthase/RimK-type ligase-like ATP-grasp enzyme
MPLHVIVVDRRADFPWPASDRVIVLAKDFVAEAARRLPASARVINLCRDYSYLSLGYYSSLLAEARGQKVMPSVEAMLDLHWKRLLRIALPEVSELVRRTFQAQAEDGTSIPVTIFFGVPDDGRLAVAARRIFELFRCPILSVELRYRNGWYAASIQPISIREVRPEQQPVFVDALDRYTHGNWRHQRPNTPARFSIGILHDPKEAMAPSNGRALERFVKIGQQMGIDVELITRGDYSRLLEYDALFIRETTALDHHTYRFARKAEAEGMPVIDDPQSILKCTNKIYLAELLQAHGVPTPKTLILNRRRIGRIERELGFPAVIKIPDGSFSRGVFKVTGPSDLGLIALRLFKDTDLLIAQEYMETPFDWRVGVLDRRPLFVCQYFMARNHWQVVKHGGEKGPIEGSSRTLPVDAAPPQVIEVATRAAGLIGNGLYGVDLKQTAAGVFVVEINDNPNIDAGIEDAVLKDELYRTVLAELVRRLEKRTLPATRCRDGALDGAARVETLPALVPEEPRPLRRLVRGRAGR